ncbi:hypothetical protein RhiirB3_533577 [Rhizophagus irregularis]|nr:hypothetical protein RhiirB3_533577 [Rhizophagus irregularis]
MSYKLSFTLLVFMARPPIASYETNLRSVTYHLHRQPLYQVLNSLGTGHVHGWDGTGQSRTRPKILAMSGTLGH